jgi:hypothetical protein
MAADTQQAHVAETLPAERPIVEMMQLQAATTATEPRLAPPTGPLIRRRPQATPVRRTERSPIGDRVTTATPSHDTFP